MDSPTWCWSAVETATAMRQRPLSGVEAVQAALERFRATHDDLNEVTVDLI